ncbi:MAG: hypothetical protein N0E55_19105 [Candidatus Thiodiazotropha taylori]|uniref:Uncharacterized protein n=1 Tax=Candidatus Thiodiazotropha taylori TaxID=2792791 RepID=A0A9E4P902_9GAMM|nr:hypothetical protein [Candidatus Thiodiazotropha taylori]MCG8016111.1 hypothetical protein [Candidatus Thiodiazotropha sp. 'RUGA']RLW69469.1 MAG: hypothetical protein B6D71_10150 [gamma proteobacterium symbiont of Stewartia floridana]MCG7948744.1 hypothetical protein [Candidatus Thiodiazotropha taylori]MCG7955091.1 hypothetical protein [Candidatus Thiodiazotropha taylori]
MSDEKEKIHIFDRQENVDRLLKGFYAICVLLVVLDLILHRHIGFVWEKLPAFYAIYGFVACVLLVVIAKKMRNVLMRGEDYYDE